MIAIIVPVAALLGTAVALAFNSTFDQSSSQVPAFQAGLARQNEGGAVANHTPRRIQRAERPAGKRPARKRTRRRAARVAAVSAPALQPQVGTTLQSATTLQGGRGADVPTQTGVQPPVTKPSPPQARPAPKPKPTPAPRPSGGGGSFDDSG